MADRPQRPGVLGPKSIRMTPIRIEGGKQRNKNALSTMLSWQIADGIFGIPPWRPEA